MTNPHTPPDTHRSINHDIRRGMKNAILGGMEASFSLLDIAPTRAWLTALRGDANQFLVGSALDGALSALRVLGTLPIDAEGCSITPPNGAVTTAEMSLARTWIATALRTQPAPTILQSAVTTTLAARGWLNNSIRITSLILAIYAVASRAGEKSRAAVVRT